MKHFMSASLLAVNAFLAGIMVMEIGVSVPSAEPVFFANCICAICAFWLVTHEDQ